MTETASDIGLENQIYYYFDILNLELEGVGKRKSW